MLFLKQDRYIGRSLDVYGEYSELEAQIFARHLRPGDCVIEVGSNIGAHTVPLAKLVGSEGVMHAFEPQRILFQLLCANLALNELFHVRTYQAAAGRQEGTIISPLLDYAAENNFGGISMALSGPGEKVPLHAIDSLDLRQLHLLKADVEGMEGDVLAGARDTIARCRPILYVENDRKSRSGELIALIAGLGYDMWWHLPRMYNPANFAGDRNNVFGDIISINLLCFPKERAQKVPDLRPVRGADDWWRNPPREIAAERLGKTGKTGKADAEAETLFHRALKLHRQGKCADAEILYRAALDLRPNDFDTLNMLGVTAYQQGRLPEAEDLLRRAILIKPDAASVHSNLGIALQALGRMQEALSSYDTAVELKADYAEALNNRATLLRTLKRPQDSLASSERALQVKPDYAEALNTRGLALRDLKRRSEALASYDQALKIKPDFAEALNNRGNVLLDLKRPEEALANFDRAVQIRPDYVEALNNRGNALMQLRRFKEALDSYDAAVAKKPDYGFGWSNRGNALRDLGRPAEALASYDRAATLMPGYPKTHNNRGHALLDLKRVDEALAAFDDALKADSGYHEARAMRGITKLLAGRYREGWEDYEFRWHFSEVRLKAPLIDAPVWNGETLAGKRIAVYGEQGLGDIIQFARYLPLLVQQRANVTFIGPPNLMRLLRWVTRGIQLAGSVDRREQYDLQCALLSLPSRFGTELSSIPNGVPYIRSEEDLIRFWREKMGARGFKIGIAWQGSPTALIDRGRSIPLQEFTPLCNVPNVRLISLQKKHGLDQLQRLPAGMAVERLGDEFDAGPDAFIDTAAVMQTLDMIITSDTSVAHVAGALGRPCWVALKHIPDWRWHLDRDDSPWYPTLRLFRQQSAGDWASVFAKMAEELRVRLNSRQDSSA